MRVKDPVCGKRFYLDEAATQHEHDGWLYFFHSDRCLRLFEMSPEQFTDKSAPTNVGTVPKQTDETRRLICEID